MDYLRGGCYSLDIAPPSIRRWCVHGYSPHCVEPQLPQLPAPSVKENPASLDNMDFNGTWQVYFQENYEEFLKAMGEKTDGWQRNNINFDS